jgi:hypothetical protein
VEEVELTPSQWSARDSRGVLSIWLHASYISRHDNILLGVFTALTGKDWSAEGQEGRSPNTGSDTHNERSIEDAMPMNGRSFEIRVERNWN